MSEKTDQLTRWILMRFARKAGKERFEQFLSGAQGLVNNARPDRDRDGVTTSAIHVIPDGRYELHVKAETGAIKDGWSLNVTVRMTLTHSDGWTLDPEGGLSLIAPEALRVKHMEMVREGKLRLSHIIEADDLPDCNIKEMGSLGDHGIYIPQIRTNLSWHNLTYKAHAEAMKEAA